MQASDAAPFPDPDCAGPVRLILDRAAPSGADVEPGDPAELLLTCASCGARMAERKCKLICRCGYFLSCSDYY